jgi:hypothetical protein
MTLRTVLNWFLDSNIFLTIGVLGAIAILIFAAVLIYETYW